MRRSTKFFALVAISIAIAACNNASNTVSQSGAVRPDVRAEDAKLSASDAQMGDIFGFAVAISGDAIVIGADQHDQATGAAYVFARNGTSWSEQAELVADDAAPGDRFGFSVAIDGDTIVVGARGDDVCGSAYVFIRGDQGWRQQGKLMADDAADDDRFGRSVAISGNVAVVGADRNDDEGLNTGSAYVFI